MSIAEMKLEWLRDPPFLNSLGIIIHFTNDDRCPNDCGYSPLTCNIYDIDGNVIKTIPSKASPSTILSEMLKAYFPKKEERGREVPNLDSRHVNIIVFRGDFMIPKNFEFISEAFSILQDMRIGMKIVAETIGSNDKRALPILLSEGIIDAVNINLGVYSRWDENVSQYAYNALNSLTQCIDAKTDGNLEFVGISFLFDSDSDISVFSDYLTAIYKAYSGDPDEEDAIFSMFNVYLRGDGTEREGILKEAYDLGVQIFDADKIKIAPVPADPKEACIFCRV